MYSLAGQFNLSIEQYRRAMDLDPNMYQPHCLLALTYMHVGRPEEAIAEAQKAYELSGCNARMAGALAWAYGLARRQGESRALLKQLITQCRKTYVPASAMMWAYFGLGDIDQAFKWLEKGFDERDLIIVCQINDPLLRMHGHPRYQGLLRKMNLEH